MCEICRRAHCPPGCPNYVLPPPAAECACCGDLILEGEDCYMIGGKYYCEDCIDGFKCIAGEE